MYYQRLFHFGQPGPHESDKVYICGSWTAFDCMLEMDRIATGRYRTMVAVGDTRREAFHLIVNADLGQRLHPGVTCGGRDSEVLGPHGLGAGMNWVINAKEDQAPAWSIYQVTFEWSFSWDYGDSKVVRWELQDKVLVPKLRRQLHKHVYSIVGSWTSWRFHEMTRSREEEGLWTASVRIGLTGQEEFQFVRDNDWTQSIHPAVPRARKTSIPIIGPDEFGTGKNWLVTGLTGDVVRIQLRVVNGEITMTTASENKGVRTWQSTEDDHWMQYFLTATWNNWQFTPMSTDPFHRDVHRYRVQIGPSYFEEFKIVGEKDWDLQLYPDLEHADEAEAVMCGPDSRGHGFNWRISGRPGQLFEIVLNMSEPDRRQTVTWTEVFSLNLPSL